MVTLVTSQVLDALRFAALRAYPKEACGILLGEGARIISFREVANVHHAPETHFEIDPAALIAAYKQEREGGLQVLGYFHSHPYGPAKPSKTDQESAAGDGKIWAIFGEGAVRFWRDEPSGFAEVSYALRGR